MMSNSNPPTKRRPSYSSTEARRAAPAARSGVSVGASVAVTLTGAPVFTNRQMNVSASVAATATDGRKAGTRSTIGHRVSGQARMRIVLKMSRVSGSWAGVESGPVK